MSAGLRFTSRSFPLPSLIAGIYGCCRYPRRKLSISLMQGKGTLPLPLHPIPSPRGKKNCQGCARSKLSGMPPAIHGELAEDPTLRQLVIEDDGIAIIIGLAAASES